MGRITVFLLFLICLAGHTSLAATKIVKVLPHFLDLEGRESLNPSLYERDVYQAILRRDATKRSALRFDIQWRAKQDTPLTLRVEMRGDNKTQATKAVIEKSERHVSGFSKWSGLILKGEEYRKFGELIAWRVTLWDGEMLLSEKKSFLW